MTRITNDARLTAVASIVAGLMGNPYWDGPKITGITDRHSAAIAQAVKMVETISGIVMGDRKAEL